LVEIADIISNLGGRDKLEAAVRSNMAWIVKSFKVNNYLGSSGTRTIRGSWGKVYPETTGYLVPTLLDYANYFDDQKVRDLALGQLDFFKSIQNEDGSFRQAVDLETPIVFDTAQIVLGLHRLASETDDPNGTLGMINRAVDWLGLQLDDEGLFNSFNYVDNYNPAYYARIAWPMASGELIKYSKPRTKTKKLIKRIVELRLETIAGSYDENWNGDYTFQCCTGNAQLALMNLILYERSGYKKNLEVVGILLAPLLKKQRKILMNAGAIPSSIPIKGEYQRFKYTNWTQKFYCDALLKLLELS